MTNAWSGEFPRNETKQYYECHITMTGHGGLSQIVEQTGWKFSIIDGDIDLGDGVKCYATRQYNKRKPLAEILKEMNETAETIQKSTKGKILRKKIELIIYDERSK